MAWVVLVLAKCFCYLFGTSDDNILIVSAPVGFVPEQIGAPGLDIESVNHKFKIAVLACFVKDFFKKEAVHTAVCFAPFITVVLGTTFIPSDSVRPFIKQDVNRCIFLKLPANPNKVMIGILGTIPKAIIWDLEASNLDRHICRAFFLQQLNYSAIVFHGTISTDCEFQKTHA
jgi:hypothetical protein